MPSIKQFSIHTLAVAIIFFLSAPVKLTAQEGMVTYRQVWNLNVSLPDKNIHGIRSVLYFNAVKSLYVYDRSADTGSGSRAADLIRLGFNQVNFDQHDPWGNMIYKDAEKNRLVMRQLLFGEAFISEEPLPHLPWNLVPGEKNIGGFACKKAVARFRGRDYEAWYAPAIPVSAGPWKFNGLAGLILEVCDQNKEVCFFMESVNIPYDTHNDLQVPVNGRPVPFSEFNSIELKRGKKLLDSLKILLNPGDDNQILLGYFPIEKNFE